jgi:hypothetical protein
MQKSRMQATQKPKKILLNLYMHIPRKRPLFDSHQLLNTKGPYIRYVGTDYHVYLLFHAKVVNLSIAGWRTNEHYFNKYLWECLVLGAHYTYLKQYSKVTGDFCPKLYLFCNAPKLSPELTKYSILKYSTCKAKQ